MIEIDSATMLEAFFNGIFMVLESAIPVIMPIIVSTAFFGIIKWIGCRLWDFINFTSSKRETRRAHKKICNAVEGVSSLMDLADATKKK